MNRVLVLANHNEGISRLVSSLEELGYYPTLVSAPESLLDRVMEERPDVLLMEFGILDPTGLKELVSACKSATQPLIVGLLSISQLKAFDPNLGMDDFVLSPYQPLEVASRLKHLLWKTLGPDISEVLKAGDLVLDLSRYEVYMAGKKIELTFKEYELLRFLASNPGRVFTREALLKRVWGYDYFGGTRTVDVHIRRLRSKIEDAKHIFVDTIRNVGYRFRE